MNTTAGLGRITGLPEPLPILWKGVCSMREANVFRKNRAFYSGVILTVVEGLLSGCSYLSIYMVLSGLSEGSLLSLIHI